MSAEGVVLFKGVALAVWFAALFVLERLRPAAKAKGGAARLATNGALWILVLLVSPLIVLPLAAFAAEHALVERTGALASWPGLVLDLALLDLWTYWVHRAYHETPLWRLHKVHHYDAHLDTTSAVRFHAGEVVVSALLRMAPIVLFGIPFFNVVLFETLLLGSAMFHHSNIRLPAGLERPLSRIVVTPSIHWVHHHARRADTNSNYAGILSIWDRAFGTRSATARDPEMKIGIEGAGTKGFLQLLLAPMEKNR